MKNNKIIFIKTIALSCVAFLTAISCERPISDEVEFAKFPAVAEIFTDTPVGLGSDFYFPYLGSKATAWSLDNEVSYEGTTSMRFDVPNARDPEGGYAGAIFRIDGEGSGRDLTGFDALTFWAKAGQAAIIAEFGFGEDFLENKFLTTKTGVQLTTNWRKYIIPIPDPSKLIQERGMLRYAAGGIGPQGNEVGYTFWLDEVRFEKLGTIAQAQPKILNGQDVEEQTFAGSQIDLASRGLSQTYNVNGTNVTVNVTPAYFNFSSSDNSVATVNESGVVTLIGEGSATITGSISGVPATGSLIITAGEGLTGPDTPTRPAANVKSIYSGSYTPATTVNFTPGFGGSTTETVEISAGGNLVQSYKNNNYTGIIFDSTIDASALTHIHVDVYTDTASSGVGFQIRDIGGNGVIDTDVNTGNPTVDDKDFRFNANGLTAGEWKSFDIVLGGDITSQKNNLGAIIITGGPDFILDNIYFYSE